MPIRNRVAIGGPTSRDRTAQMLRRLRELTREIRLLKANIDNASANEHRPYLRRRH